MQLKKSGPNRQIEKVLDFIRQCQTTHIFGYSEKNIGAWLGCFATSAIQSWPCTIWFFLFRSLQNSLNGEKFKNYDDVKSYLIQFFAYKNKKFYEREIIMLPERWQKVIDQNGQYITELVLLFSSMKKCLNIMSKYNPQLLSCQLNI